jgi:hypothetical protein
LFFRFGTEFLRSLQPNQSCRVLFCHAVDLCPAKSLRPQSFEKRSQPIGMQRTPRLPLRVRISDYHFSSRWLELNRILPPLWNFTFQREKT